jgi:hypothetical protein
LFHFEHRAHLPIPEAFQSESAAFDAGEPPEWVDGVLPERKYHSFSHDSRIGSFHPGHRGKWSAHELCHGLVGTAWRSGANTLFHATAGRLAELLPVVLYYFLDEVRLRRCTEHAGGGPLFRGYCDRCEAAASAGPRPIDVSDRGHLDSARRYLEAELARVADTRAADWPVGHRWGSLDLCTDGLAYAAAHEARLNSAAFHRWAEAFPVATDQLDGLLERIGRVTRAICEGADLDPIGDRWDWVVQDLAWRALVAAELLDGDRAAAALATFELLASEAPSQASVRRARSVWGRAGAHAFPVFTTGVARDQGVDLRGLGAGLRSVCPLTMDLFEDAGVNPVMDFAASDSPVRRPLGDRFSDWLGGSNPQLQPLAAFESALRHAGSDGLASVVGARIGPVRLADGVRLIAAEVDPMAMAEAVEKGEVSSLLRAEGVRLTGVTEEMQVATRLVVGRDGAGEVMVLELALDAAEVLSTTGLLDTDTHEMLVSLGLVRPRQAGVATSR